MAVGLAVELVWSAEAKSAPASADAKQWKHSHHTSCKSWRCRGINFTARDEASIRDCQQQVPVRAASSSVGLPGSSPPDEPFYLFIMCPPFSGSSATLSMIATSPRVATLCPFKTWQCEGTFELVKRKMIKGKERWAPGPGIYNWTEVLPVYEEAWQKDIQRKGPQAFIRVDKSPPFIQQVDGLAAHFTGRASQVAFLFVTRSPCYWSRLNTVSKWDHYAQMLVHGLEVVQRSRFKHMVLQYEKLVTSPCAAAEDVLRWLPNLETLNPGRSGYFTRSKKRNKSVVDYALAKASKRVPLTRPTSTCIGVNVRETSRQLGYRDEDWLSSVV